MKRLVALALGVMALCSFAAAQMGATGAPNVIVLLREDIKQGKMGVHDSLVLRRMSAVPGSRGQEAPFLGGVAATGNTNERLEISMVNSLADWEKDNAIQDKIDSVTMKDADFVQATADVHQSAHTLVCRLNKDISYAPDKLDFANARYVVIRTLRFKPGYASEYMNVHKDNVAEHQRTGLTDYWAVYHVMFGAPYDTYVMIQPVKSLADLDVDFDEVHKPIMHSMWERYDQASRDGLLSEDRTIMQLRPIISQPPASYVAANAAFWQPNSEMAVSTSAPEQKAKVKKATLKH